MDHPVKAKAVQDPKGLGRSCVVDLYQGFGNMTLNSTKTEEVRISAKFWSYQHGEWLFILFFPALLVAGMCFVAFWIFCYEAMCRASAEVQPGDASTNQSE